MMKSIKPVLLTLVLMQAVAMSSGGDEPKTKEQREKQASPTSAEQVARNALAKFAKGDPGWKTRMEALVALAKAGPAAAPALIEALKNSSPSAREFAAQALTIVVDPAARPALVQALDDSDPRVHIYALKALNMLGRLELSKPQRERLKKDVPYWMREYIDTVSERSDTPNTETMRKALVGYDLATIDSARTGHVAPPFALTDGSGTIYRLNQFRGKKVVLLEFSTAEG